MYYFFKEKKLGKQKGSIGIREKVFILRSIFRAYDEIEKSLIKKKPEYLQKAVHVKYNGSYGSLEIPQNLHHIINSSSPLYASFISLCFLSLAKSTG